MTHSKVLTVCSLALVLVVCSASMALAEPLSKQEWRVEAAQICTDANSKIYAIAADELGFLPEGQKPTTEQTAAFAAKAFPVLKQAVDDVVALEEPSSLKKGVKRWVVALRKAIKDVGADPTLLLAGSTEFDKVNALAKKVGLAGCTGA